VISAIFIDRDGVIVEDRNLLCSIKDIKIPLDVYKGFKLLKYTNLKKIVVSNQTVISRGIATEKAVEDINQYISSEIFSVTGSKIDKFYICPHHPEATLIQYRHKCDCRKPKSGMLIQAALEFDIDLSRSWMIGDRISDIIAGNKAGCKTMLVTTGMHNEKPIISEAMDLSIQPDYVCSNFLEAVKIILNKE
jgi:D-glycero-D-manno-heptose 1,7-bisphosphate phosphatase